MQDNLNALDELNKGTTMGINAIELILDKIENKKFKKELKKQRAEYIIISQKVKELYKEYNEKEPHEINTIEKAMTWSGVQMKTINDKSDSKYADLLIQGTNMGIIEGRKLLNNKPLNKNIKKLIEEFVVMQEESVEILKEFL